MTNSEIQQKNIVKHLSQLIGKSVVSLVVDNHDASMTVWGLKFHDGTIA